MAVFQTKSRDAILLRMVARMVARTKISDLNAGSGLTQTLGAVAREVEDIHLQMANLLDMLDPATMDSEDLDSWAVIVQPDGVPARRGASRATGAVVLATLGASTVSVARGHIFGADSELFETTASVIIPAGGSIAAPIRAREPGISGNVGSGTITRIVTTRAGIDSCTNPSALTNGEDQESNSSFLDRIKRFMRSLARCNPSSLESLALTIGVTEHADSVPGAIDPGDPIKVFEDSTPVVRRVKYASLVEDEIFRGVSTLYVDEGTGFLAVPAAQLYVAQADEVLVASAVGGERRLRSAWWPIELGTPFELQKSPLGGGYADLVEGVDYTINRSNGRIVLGAALVATDAIRIHAYSPTLDLARAVQVAVEGDPSDPVAWPGWRPAGCVVYVRRPTVLPIDVTGVITVGPGYDPVVVGPLCRDAVTAYLNTLPIGAAVIWAQLIEEVMAVAGVTDVILSNPTGNVAVPDQNVARTGTILF